MKKFGILVLCLGLMLSCVPAFAAPSGIPDGANKLFQMNIIGVDNPKNANMDPNGSTIFVPLNAPAPIWLYEDLTGEGFKILDANGTDKNGASFQMPDPDLDPYIVGQEGDRDVWSAYSIYIRPLGKPGGWASITTCADLLDSTFAGLLPKEVTSVLNRKGIFGGYASVEQVSQEMNTRPKGQSTFANVTAELTTIVFKVTCDINNDGIIDPDSETFLIRVPIFSDILEHEYWEYDNHGLKLLQVRIYDNSTDVSLDDGTWNNLP